MSHLAALLLFIISWKLAGEVLVVPFMKSFIVGVIPITAQSGTATVGATLDIFVTLTRSGPVFPAFADIAGIKMLMANKAINTIITCLMISAIFPLALKAFCR